MKKSAALCYFIILILLVASCKEKEHSKPAVREITLGVRDSLYSDVLNESREIWVYVPEANRFSANGKKYPVVYLLDGDAHFYSVAGMIHQLSSVNGNTLCPEMIVVAIPNTDRTRDLTPTHVHEEFGDTTWVKTSGGGENFTRFIKEELMPYVDEHYPTSPYRTLIGHSLGGLFAINTLVNHPEMFDNYLSIDPSLWWDDEKLSSKANEVLGDPRYSGKSLFVAVANTMAKGMDVSTVHQDTTEDTEHIRSILKFNANTEKQAQQGLNFQWKYYGDDTHGSVPLIAEYNALRHLFSWYNFEGVNEFFLPNSKLTALEAEALVVKHFNNISGHFGYTVLPDEAIVNSFGYGFLQNKKPEHAYAFFKMNIQNFPESANAHDSMGDYYMAQGDTANAIEHFKKAVDMGRLSYSQEKLDKLNSK